MLFESCSGKQGFCSGSVRVGFENCSGIVRDRFVTGSGQIRDFAVSASGAAEELSKKSRRNVGEISLLSAFNELFGINLIRSKTEAGSNDS